MSYQRQEAIKIIICIFFGRYRKRIKRLSVDVALRQQLLRLSGLPKQLLASKTRARFAKGGVAKKDFAARRRRSPTCTGAASLCSERAQAKGRNGERCGLQSDPEASRTDLA
jgi:hypothetical protein